jgi:hypothetical protein
MSITLNWRQDAEGFALHFGRARSLMLRVVRDAVDPETRRGCAETMGRRQHGRQSAAEARPFVNTGGRCIPRCKSIGRAGDRARPWAVSIMSTTRQASTEAVAGGEAERLLELGLDGRAPPVDLLAQLISALRVKVSDRGIPIKQRLRVLWAFAVEARDLGAGDVVRAELIKTAVETRLLAELGRRHGAADLEHLLRWAFLGRSPFEDG